MGVGEGGVQACWSGGYGAEGVGQVVVGQMCTEVWYYRSCRRVRLANSPAQPTRPTWLSPARRPSLSLLPLPLSRTMLLSNQEVRYYCIPLYAPVDSPLVLPYSSSSSCKTSSTRASRQAPSFSPRSDVRPHLTAQSFTHHSADGTPLAPSLQSRTKHQQRTRRWARRAVVVQRRRGKSELLLAGVGGRKMIASTLA